jgi:hypothetical protein
LTILREASGEDSGFPACMSEEKARRSRGVLKEIGSACAG